MINPYLYATYLLRVFIFLKFSFSVFNIWLFLPRATALPLPFLPYPFPVHMRKRAFDKVWGRKRTKFCRMQKGASITAGKKRTASTCRPLYFFTFALGLIFLLTKLPISFYFRGYRIHRRANRFGAHRYPLLNPQRGYRFGGRYWDA